MTRLVSGYCGIKECEGMISTANRGVALLENSKVKHCGNERMAKLFVAGAMPSRSY